MSRSPASPSPREPAALSAADIMSVDPVTLRPDMPLRAAAQLLYEADFSGAPVVDDGGELIGVLSEHDLLGKEAPIRATGCGQAWRPLTAATRPRQSARYAAGRR